MKDQHQVENVFESLSHAIDPRSLYGLQITRNCNQKIFTLNWAIDPDPKYPELVPWYQNFCANFFLRPSQKYVILYLFLVCYIKLYNSMSQ